MMTTTSLVSSHHQPPSFLFSTTRNTFAVSISSSSSLTPNPRCKITSSAVLNRHLSRFTSPTPIFKPNKLPSPLRCSAALTPELKSTLDKFVTSNKVVVFMKGTKDFPQCGFSNTVVQILKTQNVDFETFNILENEMLRQALKEYSSWPTFPQLYIDGEFFGGCDITVEAYKNGELQEVLEKTMCS